MDLSESIKRYDKCHHKWKFHIDAGRSGGPAGGNSLFICELCGNEITLLEKIALDTIMAQNESLKIQEKHTLTGMWANIIAAGLLGVAIITLLVGKS